MAKRDHRRIGKQLDLYHMQEEAPGMVFWHHDGWTIFRELEQFVRDKLRQYDYQEVKGPLMMDRVLWERSGHWDKYAEFMFTTNSENRDYAIKPMNCPGHVQIFNQGLKSYRDLPLRMGEFGSCHRNEPSGALHGLMRVRGFTQDDAHIFCTEAQIQSEVADCIQLVYDTYKTFGFTDILVKLSTRPEVRIGSDEAWDMAELALQEALTAANIEYILQPGEGAFYGPKIEFTLHDCLNRAWQCGTIQLDFALPGRLGASYVGEDNERHVPVMIHRAILGSIERFIGILIEEYAGLFPTWLAPTQVVVLNITDNQADYALNLSKSLNNIGIRAKADLRNEKIGFKIREHTLKRVPFMLVCGDKEVEAGKVAVRTRKGLDLGIKRGSKPAPRNRLNEEIRLPEVRLVGLEGEPMGVVTIAEALEISTAAGVDLVEISPNAEPPVCRLMDYGKFLYEKSKATKEQKKKQKQVQVKEMKFRPGTDDGDYQVKLRNLVRFLEEGNKAKITLRFRGREMAHQDLGFDLLNRIKADLEELAVVEAFPKMEGRQAVMVLAPKKKQ